jgi:hypothetical protein
MAKPVDIGWRVRIIRKNQKNPRVRRFSPKPGQSLSKLNIPVATGHRKNGKLALISGHSITLTTLYQHK